MTRNQQRVMVVILLLGAVATSSYFVEYRVQPISAAPGSFDVILGGPDEILFLGETEIEPSANSDLARFHGKIAAERGLFARHGFSPLSAAIGGLIVPLVLFIVATYVALRRSRIGTPRSTN